MRTWMHRAVVCGLAGLLTACGDTALLPASAGYGPDPELPEPDPPLLPTVNVATAEGWPADRKPDAAQGTRVNAFARDLQHPRWLYELPNGDVLVAESNAPPDNMAGGFRSWVAGLLMGSAGAGVPSADRITLLRDNDEDGVADERHVFLDNLHSPFGMALVGERFYVANANALVVFDYEEGANRIDAEGREVTSLRLGSLNHHWTKNVLAGPQGDTLYVAIGSNSNIAENGLDEETGRAAIWAIDPDSGENRIFASGLRNPVGMAWHPETGELWTVVNERDELGSDLVPDYLTSVQEGGFYGWPWSYYGDHVDERVTPMRPERVAEALAPDYAVGNHTAPLGLAWLPSGLLPAPFGEGMLVGQHGSWNRRPPSGYRVIFIPFDGQGHPSGEPVELLSGFREDDVAYGRPAGVTVTARGDVLVADDVGNTVWRVAPAD